MKLKEQLYNRCNDFVINKEQTILKTIQLNTDALNSETKSSAGDKHETGRAMLQLEMEKASQQLEVVHTMKSVLQRIDITKSSDAVTLGSVVITNNGNYFLSISAGRLEVDEVFYYAVSTESPIGKLLLGEHVGAIVTFQKEIAIREIF